MKTITDTVHIASPVEATPIATRNGLLEALRLALPPGKRVRAVRIRTEDDTLVGEVDREWVAPGPRPGAAGGD